MCAGIEDDKFQLPFTVTDLKGQNLQLVTGPHNGQVSVCHTVTVSPSETLGYLEQAFYFILTKIYPCM